MTFAPLPSTSFANQSLVCLDKFQELQSQMEKITLLGEACTRLISCARADFPVKAIHFQRQIECNQELATIKALALTFCSKQIQ
jgi:hypothetical protein